MHGEREERRRERKKGGVAGVPAGVVTAAGRTVDTAAADAGCDGGRGACGPWRTGVPEDALWCGWRRNSRETEEE